MFYSLDIVECVKVIRKHFDTMIWVKLDLVLFNLDEDIYLCSAYVWGADSPAYTVVNVNLFEILESDIDEFSSVGAVYAAGELNGRVVRKPAYISIDANINGISSVDYTPDVPSSRASDDQTLNAQGVQILDVCKSTGLRVCNGRNNVL